MDFPPSHVSRATGEDNERMAQNALVTSKDILCNDTGDEDEWWSKNQERQAQEQAKARAEAKRGKENKPRSEQRHVNVAKIGEFEKARKEQQRHTNKNRLTKGIKGLLQRK